MKRIFLSTAICLLVASPLFAQASLVSQVKDTLVLQGQTFTTNCDAFEITRRVAWLLRGQGAQLIGKRPEQNGCDFGGQRYSLDAIAFPTGWRDILGSAGPPVNANIPAWELTGTDPNAPLFAPFDPGGTVVPPPPVVPPVVVVPPSPDLQVLILAELRMHEAAEAVERAKAEAFRAAVGTEYKKFFVAISKYVLPAIGALFAGRAMAK